MITLPSQVGPNQERDLGVSMERSSEDKGKEPWLLYSSQIGRGGPPPLMGAGFSWPPRSYFCSFCKREFKSAQALGGHMNVHRRDRARLRQSPPLGPFPLFDLNPNPNPNPNLLRACPDPPITTTSSPPNLNLPPPPSSPPPAKLLSLSTTTSLPFISSPLTHFSAAAADLNTMEYFTVKDFLGEQAMNTDLQTKAAREIVRLDLEIGSFEDHNKDHVDLELRLGYI